MYSRKKNFVFETELYESHATSLLQYIEKFVQCSRKISQLALSWLRIFASHNWIKDALLNRIVFWWKRVSIKQKWQFHIPAFFGNGWWRAWCHFVHCYRWKLSSVALSEYSYKMWVNDWLFICFIDFYEILWAFSIDFIIGMLFEHWIVQFFSLNIFLSWKLLSSHFFHDC